MATFIQHGEHYFGGTRGDDYLVGDATPGSVLVGGDGDDVLTPGIVTSTNPADRITVYGDGVLDGFGHPDVIVYDKPGSIAHRARAGSDNIAIGQNILGAGGAGHDTYTVHGGQDAAKRSIYAQIKGFDVREDTLITDHSAGVRFDRLVKDDFFRLSDGTGKVTVHQFDMHTSSTNPVVGTEAEGRGQHVTVKTVSIGHDTDFHPFVVKVDKGETWQHAVLDELKAAFGHETPDFLL